MKPISEEEFLKIGASLEDYHSCFYVFFNLAGTYFIEDGDVEGIKTAAVSFPIDGSKPTLLLNEEFWSSLSQRMKEFVICHETLHVLLDHGFRNGLGVNGATPEDVNVAQDITINEMIVDLFGFNRNEIEGWEKYCWIDTCFENPQTIRRNEEFTYYLEMLVKNGKKDRPQTIDIHITSGGETPQQRRTEADAAKQIAEELNQEQIEAIIGASDSCGTAVGEALQDVLERKSEAARIKFPMLVRKLKRSALVPTAVDRETFTHVDRRFESFLRENKDLVVPGTREEEKQSEDRLLTAVFMDVSGSCIEHVKTFKKVIAAFENEKALFETRLFVFSTSVREVKIGDTIGIGMGTRFGPMESKCLELEEERRYPDCVVVISDGDAEKLTVKHPSRWVWLLTDDAVTWSIPPKSKNWKISQVTF